MIINNTGEYIETDIVVFDWMSVIGGKANDGIDLSSDWIGTGCNYDFNESDDFVCLNDEIFLVWYSFSFQTL